jgi:hypothetical protein
MPAVLYSPETFCLFLVQIGFYQEPEHVFSHSVPKWHMKMLDLIVKINRENIFKVPVRKVHLHKISNDNGVKINKFCHIQKSNCPEHKLVALQHS